MQTTQRATKKAAPLPKSTGLKPWGLGLAALAALGLAAARPAQAQVLTFDDITTASLTFSIPNNYHGFDFTNVGVINTSDPTYSGFQGLDRSAVSGTYVGYNPNFGVSTVTGDGGATFAFDSGYFTAFDEPSNGPVSLTITAQRGGVTLGSEVFTINDSAPTLVTLDQSLFGDVDTVAIDDEPSAVAFDNLTFNGAGAASAPEPSSAAAFALTGLGAAGLILRARKRRGAA